MRGRAGCRAHRGKHVGLRHARAQPSVGMSSASLGLALRAPTPVRAYLPPPRAHSVAKRAEPLSLKLACAPTSSLSSGQRLCRYHTCQLPPVPHRVLWPVPATEMHSPGQLQPCCLVSVSGCPLHGPSASLHPRGVLSPRLGCLGLAGHLHGFVVTSWIQQSDAHADWSLGGSSLCHRLIWRNRKNDGCQL